MANLISSLLVYNIHNLTFLIANKTIIFPLKSRYVKIDWSVILPTYLPNMAESSDYKWLKTKSIIQLGYNNLILSLKWTFTLKRFSQHTAMHVWIRVVFVTYSGMVIHRRFARKLQSECWKGSRVSSLFVLTRVTKGKRLSVSILSGIVICKQTRNTGLEERCSFYAVILIGIQHEKCPFHVAAPQWHFPIIFSFTDNRSIRQRCSFLHQSKKRHTEIIGNFFAVSNAMIMN